MIKRVFIFIFLGFILSCNNKVVKSKSKSEVVQHVIYSDVKNTLIQDNINDALSLLADVDKTFANRIVIELANSDLIQDVSIKEKLDNQSAYITFDKDKLTIYALFDDGFRNGLYGFLDKLNFKFYFPGDLWTILPEAINVSKFSQLIIPPYNSINFGGGGGYPYSHPADPKDEVKKKWELWKQRNRFYEKFQTGGHYWQEFIEKNKDIIKIHPEMVSKSGQQLCVSNSMVQDLFVKDRLLAIGNNIEQYGKFHPQSLSISVEPNDGGGHCECNKCTQKGSVSNRVYFLANLVAKEVKKKYPQVMVTLLAYNEHAKTPDFKLEDNVHVTLAPYAFQDEAAPLRFIEDWTKKHKSVGIYDYWGVMIWTKAFPLKNFQHLAQEKFNNWNNLGINHIMIESSYGIGEAGIPLYLLAKHGWNKNINDNTVLQNFYKDCFGSASDIMQSMLTRWESGVDMASEKYFSNKDFEQGISVAKSIQQKQRIEAFKDYFGLLELQENILDTEADSKARSKATMDVIEYSYSIMPTLMVHSYWLPHPFLFLFDNKNTSYDAYRKSEYTKPASYWSSLNKAAYLKKIKPTPSALQKILSAANNKTNTSQKNDVRIPQIQSRSSSQSKTISIKTINSFVWHYKANERKTFSYTISIDKFPNEVPKGAINVSLYEAKSGNLIETHRYIHGQAYPRETFNIREPGEYIIEFRLSNGTMNLQWDDATGIELENGTEVEFGEYFIKNDEQTDLIFSAFWLPKFYIDGMEVKPEKIDKLYVLKNCADKTIIARGGTVIKPLGNSKLYLN